MMRSVLVAIATAVFVVPGGTPARALTFTCSTVTRQHLNDPTGAPLRGRFAGPVINGTGDVVFVGRAPNKTLYLYPNAGAPSVLVARGAAAPGGGALSDYTQLSINDAGDVGFHGRLFIGGEGVYVRPGVGGLVKAARSTDTSPPGGVFHEFPSVSRVNAAGKIAFVATVTGGPDGVFLYDTSTATLSTIAVAGDPTADGRKFCSFVGVGLGDAVIPGSGVVAFESVTQVDCNNTAETPLNGIDLYQGVNPPTVVAREGGASPFGGATFARFYDSPRVNASNQVSFRARLQGEVQFVAHFRFDPVGPTTTSVVAAGDVAPGGGFLKTVGPGSLTDAGRIGLRAKIVAGTARQGIFLYGGMAEAVVTDDQDVPSDQFGSGTLHARYRRIDDSPAIDRSGTWATYTARVRDVVSPRGKSGVFRCHGA